MDFSDLDNDPIVRFQTKLACCTLVLCSKGIKIFMKYLHLSNYAPLFVCRYYLPLGIVIFFVIPISTVHFLFPSLTLYQLICLHYLWYIYSVHATGTVNSIVRLFKINSP